MADARTSDTGREVRIGGEPLEVVVLPGLGARLHRLRAFGHELLLSPDDPATYRRDPFMWGAYVMAPWCNRLEPSPVEVDGRTVALGVNFVDGTAIHGQVSLRPWAIEAPGSFVVVGGGDGWPWRYEVRQQVSVVGTDAARGPGPDEPRRRADARGHRPASLVPQADRGRHPGRVRLPPEPGHLPAADRGQRHVRPAGRRQDGRWARRHLDEPDRDARRAALAGARDPGRDARRIARRCASLRPAREARRRWPSNRRRTPRRGCDVSCMASPTR